MALLDAFKQQVLSLGRSEARAKARPLLVDDESFERSAAGLDRRTAEAFVMFWLLSDRAVYLVAGGADGDWAFRIPYACVDEMALDFDENAPGVQEGKEWIALIEYLKKFEDINANGIPDVTNDYITPPVRLHKTEPKK